MTMHEIEASEVADDYILFWGEKHCWGDNVAIYLLYF